MTTSHHRSSQQAGKYIAHTYVLRSSSIRSLGGVHRGGQYCAHIARDGPPMF
jgi:hypothetical protein